MNQHTVNLKDKINRDHLIPNQVILLCSSAAEQKYLHISVIKGKGDWRKYLKKSIVDLRNFLLVNTSSTGLICV